MELAQSPDDMGFPPNVTSGGTAGSKFLDTSGWFERWFTLRLAHSSKPARELLEDWEALIVSQENLFDNAPGRSDRREKAGLLNRFVGCIIGLAVGDAIGAPVEHQKRGTFEVLSMTKVVGKRRGGSGMYTDDTSLALCLAYSLLKCGKFDIRHQADCLAIWYKHGVFHPTQTCYGIGRTTRHAIEKYIRSRDPYSGPAEPASAGNGSLMRLAPVPMFYSFSNPATAVKFCGQSSRTTHQAREAVDCCRFYGCLIYGALHGVDKAELLRADLWVDSGAEGQGGFADWFPDAAYWRSEPLCDSVLRIARGSYKNKSADEIRSSGYVMESIEAALWGFHSSQSFEEGMLKVVNLGHDTDTVGAIYGQLAGAYYGECSIPIDWLRDLIDHEHFYTYAQHLWLNGSCLEQQRLA